MACLGPWSAMLVIAIHQCCAGFYMALVFAPNHKGRRFAYHSWATLKLMDFCRMLDPEQLNPSAEGTLGSIERTLTHLVSSEQFYLRDLTGHDPPAWIESRIESLDQLANRAIENASRWVDYLNSGPDPDETFVTTWRGKPKNAVRWGSLTQAIGHGTEHRTHDCTAWARTASSRPTGPLEPTRMTSLRARTVPMAFCPGSLSRVGSFGGAE